MSHSQRLGSVTPGQFQWALDQFNLGTLLAASAVPYGLFGQNVFLSTSSGEYVFRGAPHYDWQLPREHHAARILHEAGLPAPWPYLHTSDSGPFPWPHGFAIMPRMAGENLADVETYLSWPLEVRTSLARSQGECLARMWTIRFDAPGDLDPGTGSVCPFKSGYVAHMVEETQARIELAMGYGAPGRTDTTWLYDLVRELGTTDEPDSYTLVHHDFNRHNMVAKLYPLPVEITGLFDLMGCHAGDGLADLPRQFAIMQDQSDSLPISAAYVTTAIAQRAELDASARKRAMLYLINERMTVWEYAHRPGHEHLGWWDLSIPLRPWLEPYIDAYEKLLERLA